MQTKKENAEIYKIMSKYYLSIGNKILIYLQHFALLWKLVPSLDSQHSRCGIPSQKSQLLDQEWKTLPGWSQMFSKFSSVLWYCRLFYRKTVMDKQNRVCVYALILSDGPKQISEQEPNDSLKWLQDNWYDEQSVDCSLQTNSGPKMSHRQENNSVGWMLGSAASQKRFSSNISLSRPMEDWTKSAKQRAKENIAASFRINAYNWRNVLKT